MSCIFHQHSRVHACMHACWNMRLIAGADPSYAMHRLAWVTGFCIGPFGGNERTWKPFNPILGETFQLDLPDNGVRFLAEQVPRPSLASHPCAVVTANPCGCLQHCLLACSHHPSLHDRPHCLHALGCFSTLTGTEEFARYTHALFAAGTKCVLCP